MRMKRFRGEGWALLGMIWALAWPTMLEQLMSTAVQYVDAAMVGRLGAQATAAVGATTTVSWLIGSTVSALGIGFLSFIAQAYGADDRARAARTSSQAVLAVLFSGTLFTVIPLLLSRRVPVWMHAAPEIQQVASLHYDNMRLENVPFAEAERYVMSYDPEQIETGTPRIWYEWDGEFTVWPKPDDVKTFTLYSSIRAACTFAISFSCHWWSVVSYRTTFVSSQHTASRSPRTASQSNVSPEPARSVSNAFHS